MRLIPVFGGYLHFLWLLGSVPLDHLYPRHTQYISKPLSESDTCRQGGRTRKYSSRWRSRTRQSLGVGSPWASQGRVSRPGRKGFKSNKSWSMTSRHALRTARSRAARGLGGVRVNWPADWDDCCCCRLSVDFLHQQWTTIETNHNTVSQAQLFTVSHMTYTLMLWWSACLLITFPCRWVEQNISSTGVFPQLNSTLPQTISGFSFTQIFALCHSTCPDTHVIITDDSHLTVRFFFVFF